MLQACHDLDLSMECVTLVLDGELDDAEYGLPDLDGLHVRFRLPEVIGRASDATTTLYELVLSSERERNALYESITF
jgi:hypothetical protein